MEKEETDIDAVVDGRRFRHKLLLACNANLAVGKK